MICRLCLITLNLEKRVPLFSEFDSADSPHLLTIIEKYLHLRITWDDEISTNICSKCFQHLHDFDKYCVFVREQQIKLSQETPKAVAQNVESRKKRIKRELDKDKMAETMQVQCQPDVNIVELKEHIKCEIDEDVIFSNEIQSQSDSDEEPDDIVTNKLNLKIEPNEHIEPSDMQIKCEPEKTVVQEMDLQLDTQSAVKSSATSSRSEYSSNTTARSKKIFLTIRLEENMKIVTVLPETEELQLKDILKTLSETFGIKREDSIVISTSHGVEVPLENLVDVVLQYRCCATFFLDISKKNSLCGVKRKISATGGEVLINSELLKTYLEDNGCNYILKEYSYKATLKDCSRRRVVNEAVNLLKKICSKNPTRDEKTLMSKAICNLFPVFGTSEEGANIFFNPATNSGYLAARIKNLTAKLNRIDAESSGQNNTEIDAPVATTNSDSKEIKSADLEFFAHCVLPQQREELKERLKKTITERQHMCLHGVDIKKKFPFFLVDPDLILFDFELRYSNLAHNFFSAWSKYSTIVSQIFDDCGNCTNTLEELNEWNCEIRKFFYLLKLLPSTAKRSKGVIVRRNFKYCMEGLIRFEFLQTHREEYNLESCAPFLIAVGANKLAINQYMLVVDENILPLSAQYDIVKAFDLLLKSFFVFNLEFDLNLKNFYTFITKFLYKFNNIKATARQQEIYTKFETKLTEKETVSYVEADLMTSEL